MDQMEVVGGNTSGDTEAKKHRGDRQLYIGVVRDKEDSDVEYVTLELNNKDDFNDFELYMFSEEDIKRLRYLLREIKDNNAHTTEK
jgi:hypothetical protein